LRLELKVTERVGIRRWARDLRVGQMAQ